MTTSNFWAWRDNFKYRMLRFQNQKVAHEKLKYFLANLIFEIKVQLKDYLRLLQQTRCFVTCWVKSGIIGLDRNLTQSIIKETIDVEKKRCTKIEMYQFRRIPELMGNLEDD